MAERPHSHVWTHWEYQRHRKWRPEITDRFNRNQGENVSLLKQQDGNDEDILFLCSKCCNVLLHIKKNICVTVHQIYIGIKLITWYFDQCTSIHYCTHTQTFLNNLCFLNVIYLNDANQNFHQPFLPVFSAIILQKSFQYVDLLSMLFFLTFYSSNNPGQNVTGSKKY